MPTATRTGGGTIAVLLATYNGASFLDEQLASLAAQHWPAIDLWASDDGSSDATPELLGRWQQRWSKGSFRVVAGPARGFSENFRSLLANPEIAADYYAFCDQDDVWDAGKLDAAVAALSGVAPGRPALYCSRTRLIDEAGRPVGLSPLFRRPPAFRNALIQSIGGGNTMLMNRAAFAALAESARRTAFVSHDWWAYMLVSGIGGLVVYDPEARTAYRQHGGNLVGHNIGWQARVSRLQRLFSGQLVRWNTANLESLARCADLLTEDSRGVVDAFRNARAASLPSRFGWLARAGVHRQSLPQDLTLWIAAAIGRI